MMTPKEVLAKAAEYMAERGQAKFFYENEHNKSVCAYGAMALAASNGKSSSYGCLGDLSQETNNLIDQAATLLAGKVESHYDTPWDRITRYNDREDVTAEDMILAMKRAAED